MIYYVDHDVSLVLTVEHYRYCRLCRGFHRCSCHRCYQQRFTLLSEAQIHTCKYNYCLEPSSELVARRRKRVLSKDGGHGNGIKVHNQRNWSANWITVRSRLIYIVSPMVTHGFCVPISLFSYSHVHTIHSHLFLFAGSHQLKILSFTIQPPTPYSPCTGTWYRIPTWHRNWFTTTLLAASALPSTSSSFVVRLLLVGLSELSVLPLLRLPTSQRHYSLP